MFTCISFRDFYYKTVCVSVNMKNGVGVTKASSAQVYRRESWVVDMSQAVSSVSQCDMLYFIWNCYRLRLYRLRDWKGHIYFKSI